MLRILYDIACGKERFLIEPHAAQQLSELLHLTLSRQIPFSAQEFSVQDRGASVSSRYLVSGVGASKADMRVHVLQMHGVMLMHGGLCSYGMIDYAEMLMYADSLESIDAHVLDINSPGGQAMYTETLAGVVANLKKPVITFANHLMASAAYWVGAAADEIILAGDTTEVGSIGTLISYLDYTRQLRDSGVDPILIRATKSTHKVKYKFDEPTEDDIAQIRTEYIDPFNEVFHTRMKSYRPGLTEPTFTGDMWMGAQAITQGLADGIGTLQSAIIRAANMADEKKKENQPTNNKKKKTMATEEKQSRFNRAIHELTRLMGIESDPQVTLEETTPAPAPEADAPVAPSLEDFTAAQAQIAQLTTERDSLRQTVSAQEQRLEGLIAEVRQLGARSAKVAALVATEELITDTRTSPFADINQEAVKRFANRKK